VAVACSSAVCGALQHPVQGLGELVGGQRRGRGGQRGEHGQRVVAGVRRVGLGLVVFSAEPGVVQDVVQAGDQVGGVHVEVAGDVDHEPSGQVAEAAGAVAGDTAGAHALYRQVIDRGDVVALWDLARLWERVGDTAGADRLRRFGLTGSGDVATGLDFG